MFNLTPAAAEQILLSTNRDADTSPALRIAAKFEDGEFVYGMGFDEERENDLVVESAGVTLLIAPRSQPLLDGATLDFVELKPGEFQFVFINPNEPPSGLSIAGCGSQGSGCGSCGSSRNNGGSCN